MSFETAHNIYSILKRAGLNPKLKQKDKKPYVEVLVGEKKEADDIKKLWGNKVSIQKKRTATGTTFYVVRINPSSKTTKKSAAKATKKTAKSKTTKTKRRKRR